MIVSGLANAQENEPETEDQERVEDTIIVVGSKLGLNLQETVDSVELLTEERLENDGVFELTDALARTPNVSVIGDNLNTINIRGINRNGTGGAGPGQAINIFLDGAPLSNNALISSADVLWDVQQVEVLRGSQSILQGRNAIAGAVVLTTNDPTYEWEGAGRAIIGEFGERRYSGLISGPIIKDQLAFRLSADYSESDGFITNFNTGGPDDSGEDLAVRGKLLFEPNALKDLRAELSVEYTESDSLRTGPVIIGSGGPAGEDNLAPERIARLQNLDFGSDVSFSSFLPSSDVETVRIIGDLSYHFTDNISVDFVGTYEQADRMANNTEIIDNPFSDLGNFSDSEAKTYSADLRVNFDYDKLTGVVGAYYFDTKADTVGRTVNLISDVVPFPLNPADSVFAFDSLGIAETDNIAAYTSWRYEPNDKWAFDVGLRYDEEKFANQSIVTRDIEILPDGCLVTVPLAFLLGAPVPGFQTLPCTQAATVLRANLPQDQIISEGFGVFLPSGAITYNINEDVSVFVGARRGYRAGGVTLAASIEDLASNVSLIEFDPEFLNTLEAGWRSVWMDGRLTFNGTAFFSEYQDQQVNFTDDRGFGITTNAGETTLYGLELSLDYAATDDWDIYGSLALKDTEFDEFLFTDDNPDTAIDETVDLTGNELSRAENLSFSIGTNYRHDSGLFGSAAVSYKSSYFSDIFNLDESVLPGGLTEKVDAAAVFNARIGYEFENGSIALVGQNIFDEDSPESINFASAGILNGSAGLSSTGNFTARPPRRFSVVLDVEF